MLYSWAKAVLACTATIPFLNFPSAIAQQFQGTPVTYNITLPKVPGAELAYFRITDSKNRQFTNMNYLSTHNDGRLIKSNIKRVVLVVHGLGRDASTYMAIAVNALSTVSGKGVTTANTQLVAPYFPNGEDKNIGYPWDATQPQSNRSWSDILVWQGGQWIGGENNQYPSKQVATSSYEVIDQYINYYANTDMFPNIKTLVVVGHSAGAQFVQRYAAVGKTLNTPFKITYWVGNPNSFLWFDDKRPLPIGSCPDYNDWRDGLENYANYSSYNPTLINSG